MFYYPIVFRGYVQTFPLSSLITVLMDELHEKSCCRATASAEDSARIKMLLGFLIVLAPALGKARWRFHRFLHKPLRKEWDGEQRSLCSALAGSVGLCCPCQTILKDICGMALGRVKARFMCLGTSPALLNPSCPSQPGVEPDSSSMTPQSLTLRDVRLLLKAPACSAIPLVQSRGIIHISDKRIGY